MRAFLAPSTGRSVLLSRYAAVSRSYDYLVVGAGSAGCVLAARLTEDPDVSVLLLEAGPSERRPEVAVPLLFPRLFGTRRDWGYRTEPQPALDGRRLYWPRGRMLGGSSSLNDMVWIRGHRSDYDGWAAGGASGWSVRRPAALLPARRGRSGRRPGLPRDRRAGAGRAQPRRAAGHPRVPARRRAPGAGEQRRPERRTAGRRLPLPGVPARGSAGERRHRIPAPRDAPAQPDRAHRRARPRHRRPRRAGDGGALGVWRPGAPRRRWPRGPAVRGRGRLATHPAAFGHRAGRRACGSGDPGCARPARGGQGPGRPPGGPGLVPGRCGQPA